MKDKFTVKVSDKGTLREYAQIALDSKMYIDDGEHLLEGEYRGIIASVGYRAYTFVREGKMRARPECIVGLCYRGDELVGCGVVHRFLLQIYVHPLWRRKGVATKIAYAMSRKYGLDAKVGMYVTDEASRCIAEHLGVVDLYRVSALMDKGCFLPEMLEAGVKSRS